MTTRPTIQVHLRHYLTDELGAAYYEEANPDARATVLLILSSDTAAEMGQPSHLNLEVEATDEEGNGRALQAQMLEVCQELAAEGHPAFTPEPPQVVDLMAALEDSVRAAKEARRR